MPELRLRDSHTSVRDYYKSLSQYSRLEATHEGAVQAAFGTLLQKCAGQFDWTVVGQYELPRDKKRALRVDAAVLDNWKLPRGYWEAKDEHDDLATEAKKKLALGYPPDNILFQSPRRAILYQNNRRVLDVELDEPATLVHVLKTFFEYEPRAFAEWGRAAEDFGEHVPRLATALLNLIAKERRENKRFAPAFQQFLQVCRTSINPALGEVAVEKMLVQHLLTERIFRKVFDNPDFARRNVIAIEIEKVVDALTGRAFSRQKFLGELDRFYIAIEKTAGAIDDHGEKQHFLNTVYERFFQRFDEKTADTHGIVYTPQSIVRFMVRGVESILREEFGRSIGHRDVHIIDPFVGTGNFLVNVMRQIPGTQLAHKYANELHANELMLLPYYIASMNIEHEYMERTGLYEPFEGMCLVDTFEVADSKQAELAFMSEANSQRVARQKKSPIFVIIGNPPYNAWQSNDSNRNKNRKHPEVDRRVAETYGRDSGAQLTSALQDPYVKAFRWATDRLRQEGVIAYVTNASFIDGIPFDGMRKHLKDDFDAVYVLDLGGNVRKNSKLSGTTHNVFGIQVGVAITVCVRRAKRAVGGGRLMYARFDEDAHAADKLKALDGFADLASVKWQEIHPDRRHTWITLGNAGEYSKFVPMAPQGASKDEAEGIFSVCSNGPKSQRDAVVWDFSREQLLTRMREATSAYSQEMSRYNAAGMPTDVDGFLDRSGLKWSDTLKAKFSRGARARFVQSRARSALWRPYTVQFAYLDELWIDRPGQLAQMFPDEHENIAIIAMSHSQQPFGVLAARIPACIDVCGRPSHVFTRFTYSPDGERRENVTDSSLERFRRHYSDDKITKADVFSYVYAVLHHPTFQERYAANLKRELPRIPHVRDFWSFANAGKKLMALHVDYENEEPYKLKPIETPGLRLDWKIEQMRLTKDRQGVICNDFLTLAGIPAQAFEYKIGNRSAIEWVVDQYRVSTDKRTGIASDPNRDDDPEYVVRLVGQIVAVSVKTMKILESLPALSVGKPPTKAGRPTETAAAARSARIADAEESGKKRRGSRRSK